VIAPLDAGSTGLADALQALAPFMEGVSLILIIGALAIISYLAFRTKTVRSFQFEMFLFMLVLAAAEAPRILETLGVITGGSYYDLVGLEIHSVSMVILAAFVGFRIYRFWRGSAS
jgi:hypothetical protein